MLNPSSYTNPYNYTNVVTDREMFFGREAVLGNLYTRLRKMGSVSVVGLRRIGKSSLLWQLSQTLADELGQDYVPMYVDLQDARYHTVAGFVKTIALRLSQSIDGAAGAQAADRSSQERTSRQGYLVRLHRMLARHFDEGELQTLCLELAVDYQDLPGKGKANKAREMILYLERRDRVADLVEIAVRERSKVPWQEITEPSRGVLAALRYGPFERVREIFKPRQLHGRLAADSVTDMASFSEMLDILTQNNIRPVLCLDEFEEFTQRRKEFNNDFLEALRSLGLHSKLAMVTASRTPLVDLTRTGQLTSPFYNIFAQLELGLLEHDAAQRLRRIPFERDSILLTPEHKVLVEELGGRHPFFLQMACHHLYHHYKTTPEPQATRAGIVLERFGHDIVTQFDRLWNSLDAREQAALRAIVGRDSLSDETKITLRRLARLGVVEQRGGEWQLFSRAFAEHVLQYPTPKDWLGWFRDVARPS
jgi:hypothetical protein